LSKRDLAAFAAVRDAEGRKLYTITPRGNTGTISSAGSFNVPYIINSAAPALSDSATATGTYCMAYGIPANYEMPIFSNLTVEESRDYKFRTGQIAYRGVIWAGGNTAKHKGFIRVKKVAAT
jgi:HK97 family phage major capsid protein